MKAIVTFIVVGRTPLANPAVHVTPTRRRLTMSTSKTGLRGHGPAQSGGVEGGPPAGILPQRSSARRRP